MDFTVNSIQPKGRLKYGTYMSTSNIFRKVSNSYYNGNTSTGGGTPASGVTPDPVETCVILLQHNTFKFDRTQLAVAPQTDDVMVIGYRGTELREVFVSDLTGLIDESDSATTTPSETYDITGLTSGMTVSVSGNGSSACTISITVDSGISVNSGTLFIPVSMCLDANGLEDDYIVWKASNDENAAYLGDATGTLYSTILEYNFELDSELQSAYLLDLTNDSAGINCDSDGNVLTGATRPTCQAVLYYGQEVVSGATFGITTKAEAAASGVSINTSTGVLTFGNNFNFVGSTLEITVSATYRGYTSIKIMTITKNYPGADGTGAITRWIVPSASTVKVNPNTGTITPASISATVMKQVGDEQPVEDSATTIWYGWDTNRPNSIYSGPITVVAAYSYLALGLKNTGGTFYELETIPILEDGVNGTNGASGQSVYRLDLSNESAGINCDINGNLLPGAVRPKCTATLYYGSTKVSNAAYSFDQDYGTGLTINSSTGVITVGTGFTWTGTSIGVVVNATVSNILRGTATFTLSKNFPGQDGANGQSTFKSTAFRRVNSTSVAAPTGGSYASPVPTTTGWSDGVPSGDAQLWMSTRIFTSDGQSPQQSAWTTPRPVTDTSSIDFEFSAVASSPGNPTSNPSNWHDTATSSDIWMAVRKSENGVWGSWEITKIKGENGTDGTNGNDAVTYWLAASADAIQVTSGGTVNPSTISCKAYKQVGENAPVELATSQTPYIYYGYNTVDPSTRYNGSTLTVDKTKNYLTFQLWYNNVQYDIETIPILHDGQNGQDGQGRAGAAIRGPVEWLSTSARRWCSGNGNASGVSMDEDYQFLDIVFRVVNGSKVYYVCNTSYTQRANTSWSSVSQYWTQTSDQYEFVASRVLLADNAYIDFMTGNEIYLRDSGGTVTAGAAGGSGISFWAGADQPGDAPFQVNYDGSIVAKSGTFSGYIQMPYTFVSDLTYSNNRYLADDRAYLVSDSWNDSGGVGVPANIVLPKPTAALNGFTYDIIVEPSLSRMDGSQQLHMSVSGGSSIYCYSFSELRTSTAVTLTGGRYVITCMPKHGDSVYYAWAITMATGGLIVHYSGKSEFLSSVMGASWESDIYTLTKIVTYSGSTKPTVNNETNTMFVQRSS